MNIEFNYISTNANSQEEDEKFRIRTQFSNLKFMTHAPPNQGRGQ